MVLHEGSIPAPVRGMRAAQAPREPGALMRALAGVRALSLDGRLAAGEDPAGSRLLAARAARLTNRRHRAMLAGALGGLLAAAQQLPRGGRVSPDSDAVLRSEAAIRELARRVGSTEPLYARGLAHLERLLTDATGPAFSGGTGDLAAELGSVAAELGGRTPPDAVRPGSRGPSARRLARLRARRAPAGGAGGLVTPGFAGESFVLPDGSWFHGRRESA